MKKQLNLRQMKSIKAYLSLIVIFLSFNAYSQYGIIEMKNGDKFEIADDKFQVEDDQLRYYKEKVESKGYSLFGIRSKKQKKEYYLDKTNTVNINDIKIIHTQGELFVGNKKIANYIGIRYIKLNRNYEEFYVIENGKCSLLIKSENSNAIFSYYLQEENGEPYILHKSGTGLGPKYKSRSKEYFADCEPAMSYIKKDLKFSTIQKLVQIYNSSCA